MKVPLIKSQVEEMKLRLQSYDSALQFYKWYCLDSFQRNWDLSDLDFLGTYERSFSSQVSNRLWVADHFYPKKIMLEFIKMDKEFVRSMFLDLFDESKDLMMRISRFVFHCDMLLEELSNKNSKLNAHYHHDYKMISIYLAFQYPEKYTIYDYEQYALFMENVGALQKPLENDLPRFFTIMKSMLSNFLSKDEELQFILEKKMLQNNLRPHLNLLLSHELYAN